jgi:hypothetical protein
MEMPAFRLFDIDIDYDKCHEILIAEGQRLAGLSVNDVVNDFLSVKGGDFSMLKRVHHVACYCGDYEHMAHIFALDRYFKGEKEQGVLKSYEMGPSYISPKEHGTQGWWYSLEYPDGLIIELFTCLDWGAWRKQGKDYKYTAMSHMALGVDTREDLFSAFEELTVESETELFSFTESDCVGHTYGHLRNKSTNNVLEILLDKKSIQNCDDSVLLNVNRNNRENK